MNIEKEMKISDQKRRYEIITVVLFFAAMIGGCILGFLLFLRPSVSEFEKRDLEKFPEFKTEAFLNGNYTSDISKWYSDSFPFRDTLIQTEQRIKTFYGYQANVTDNTAEGDDIPDLPDIEPSSSETEPGSETIDPKETTEQAENTESTESSETTPSDESTDESTDESENAESTEEETTEDINGEDLTNMNPQEAGQVNVVNLVGYCVYGFNLKAANIYGEAVAGLAEKLPDVNVYDILIPNNSAIQLDEQLKTEWKLSDESKVIRYYSNYIKSLTNKVTDVPIMDNLKAHSSEYLYFKTDHHWTQLGAYYALEEFLKIKGWELHSLDKYETIVMENFLGSYYSTNGYTQLKDNPDSITAYIPMTTNEMEFYDSQQARWRQGRIVRNLVDVLPTQKYQAFIYGDNSIEYIRNPKLGTGKTVMVIKESFGNTFIPFLADYYDKVIVIDYRGYKESLSALAKEEGVDDIIFINNLEAISDSHTMEVMKAICQ